MVEKNDNFYLPETSFPSPLQRSSSSLLQKRVFATFTDADLDDCDLEVVDEVEDEKTGVSASPSSVSVISAKEDYQLLEQRFSSYAQAFNWCQRNRYKYKHHSRNYADDLEKNKYKSYIYGCDCHGANCPNERKLEFHSTGKGTFEIRMFERGLHSALSYVPKKRGIDPRLLDFIDYLCKEDKPPRDIRYSVLRKAEAGDWGPVDDIIFPSIEQIKNRKKSVKKEDEKYQQFNRAYRVQQWTDANLLTSEEQFDSIPVDKVFTLGHLNYTYVNSNKETVECVAFAYSTKDLLRNAVCQAQSSLLGPGSCGGNADATFNLLKDNWVLHAFGCRGLKKSSEGATDFDFELTHQFRPFAFALAPTENQVVYEFLFKVTAEALLNFFQFELSFRAFCQDRSPSIANAVRSRWPECKIVLCWPHILRGAIDRGKLVDKTLVDLFNIHITYLHSARSEQQFKEVLLPLMLEHWIEMGEENMADLLDGTEPWTNWHVTSSDIPGFTPNNNAIESWNRVVKRIFPPRKSSIGKHLLEDMPTMLKQLTNELGATNGGKIVSVIPGSPNRHLLDKAMKLVATDVDLKGKGQPIVRNFFPITEGSALTSKCTYNFNGFIFNSSSTMYQNDMDNAMTKHKAKHYCLSLQGISKANWTFEEACQMTLTAHAVRVEDATPDTIHPISFPGLATPKHKYRCDCKGWWHSLVCAHVLAAMHLNNDINLNTVNAKVNKPAIPGRPASYQPVGYKAQQPSNDRELSNRKANNLKGMHVASKIGGTVFVGMINSHQEKIGYDGQVCIIWTAVFNEELNPNAGADIQPPFPRYEDYTYDSMMQANALFKTYCRQQSTNGKIVMD